MIKSFTHNVWIASLVDWKPILVNVLVGSKIQAIASMMACMMFKDIAMIKPYYVVPKKYTTH
jgi:hypothetical protein